jgi:parvulin-like peptidyl-prolyl isomerase
METKLSQRSSIRRLLPALLVSACCLGCGEPPPVAGQHDKISIATPPPALPLETLFPDESPSESDDVRTVAQTDEDNKVVAEVAGRFVSQRDVELSWLLAYERMQRMARRKGLSAEEYRNRLHEEWKAAIERLVQEQLILQQARLERERLLEQIALALSMTSDVSPMMARAQAEEKLQDFENKRFSMWRDQAVEAAGGWRKLEATLEEKGQTTVQWEEQLREQLEVRAYLEQEVGEIRVSPKQIRAHYDEHKEDYINPVRYRYREILLNFEHLQEHLALERREFYDEFVQTLAARLQQEEGRARFINFAREFSAADSAEDGGLRVVAGEQFVPEDILSPAVRDALEEMEIGDVSGPIPMDEGVRFLKLEGRKGGSGMTLLEAQSEVARAIYNEALASARQEVFEKLRARLKVVIHDDSLPAKYNPLATGQKQAEGSTDAGTPRLTQDS